MKIISAFEQLSKGSYILKVIIILFFLFSCNKKNNEEFCWNCSMIERYVNEDNEVINWYKDSFSICNKSQYEIYLFQKQNTEWIDSTRRVGTTIECQKQ